MTLTDEGTIDGGVAKRRQQKIYADVLGRTVKTEVRNWQGGSVYTTAVNTYNARDQVTLVRQYQGPEGSATYQDTTMTYDGYGRVKTRHVPEQDAGTATTYNYDDTVSSVTDARGASQTFSYNARHLIASITYSAPAGITATAPVTYSYDAAGNRTSMADGLGSVNYNYDQLSRLISENRSFTGVGAFTLNYAYDLAGQLTSMTDPFSAQVGYNYDLTGRLNAVTGSGFAGVSSYASSIQYRAWGGLKGMNYSNGHTVSLGYNARLQPASYSVPGVAGAQYRYTTLSGGTDNDGRVKFVSDTTQQNSPFDRGYSYDHATRLSYARTASLARGGGYEQTGPYEEGFGYDAWGNLTLTGGLAWSTEIPNISATYVNNRNTAWTYDADGNALLEDDMTWAYDAAGQEVYLRRPRTPGSSFVTTKERAFDGDGNYVKEVVDGNASTYYLRSTALGGKIVTRLTSTGEKGLGYVYALGGILAEQRPYQGGVQNVAWLHSDPVTGNRRWTGLSGELLPGSTELDPLGVDAGLAEPPAGQPPGEPDRLGGGGDIMNPSSGCGIENIPAPCGMVIGLMNTGRAAPCPDNRCGPRYFDGRWHTLTFDNEGLRYQRWVRDHPVNRPNNNDPDAIVIDVTGQASGHLEYVNVPQNTAQTQTPCEQKLASIFGGRDAVMRTRYDSEGQPRGRNPELAARVAGNTAQMGTPVFDAEHLYNFPHLSGNIAGTENTGIYVPVGFDARSVTGPTQRDAVVTLYYPSIDFTLAIFHVGNFGIRRNDRNDAGSIRIGTTGGRGGSSADRDPARPNLHSHFELWNGRTGYLPPGEARNAARIPFVFAYCPP